MHVIVTASLHIQRWLNMFSHIIDKQTQVTKIRCIYPFEASPSVMPTGSVKVPTGTRGWQCRN